MTTASSALDDVRRAELLVEAVRLALSSADGDPDGILATVAHPSHDDAAVHRLFATLIDATCLLRALHPYTPDACDSVLTAYDDAVTRAVLAAAVLLCGEPETAVAA